MKKVLVLLSFLFVSTVFASHGALEKGTVYNIPQTNVCLSPEEPTKFMELWIEKSLSAARAHLMAKIREKKCGRFKGGARYLETLQEWKHQGYLFRLLKLSDNKGEIFYGILGWKNHEREA